MFRRWRADHRHWEDWASMALGLGLILSPWFASFSDSHDATVCAVLAGLALLYFAQLAIARLEAWEEWINLALGLWLVVAPWVLGLTDHSGATWMHVVTGSIVAVLAIIELVEELRKHGRPGIEKHV